MFALTVNNNIHKCEYFTYHICVDTFHQNSCLKTPLI